MKRKFKIIYTLLIVFSSVLFFLGGLYLTGTVTWNKVVGCILLVLSVGGFAFSIFKIIKSGDETFKIISITIASILVILSILIISSGTREPRNYDQDTLFKSEIEGSWTLESKTTLEKNLDTFDIVIIDDSFYAKMTFSDGADAVEVYGDYIIDGEYIVVTRKDPIGTGEKTTYKIEPRGKEQMVFYYSEGMYALMKKNTEPTNDNSEPQVNSNQKEDPKEFTPTFSGKEYKEGMYKAGVDIPAGEYCVTNTSARGTFYVEVSADSSGNSIIDNDNIELFGYVSLKDGEYLKINGGSAFAVEGVGNLVDFNNGRALMGIYKVGKDIPAGEYNVQLLNGASTGYYEVNSAPIGSDSDIITNDNITSNAYVTVSDGQYIKLSNCFISLK